MSRPLVGRTLAPWRLGVVTLLGAAAACGPGPRASADGGPGADARVDAGGGLDSRPIEYSRVYAHGNGNLYRIDTQTFQPQLIGPITGLMGGESLTDIAIDKNDLAIGITLSRLYTIDLDTGAATLLNGDLAVDGFTSLSFVPLDLDDLDSDERLVAVSDQGEVYQLNPATGAATLLGSYGSIGEATIRSSGDIVAISGIGIYATVTIGDNLAAPDYLAEIDPVTWAADTLGSGTGYDRIFGLGFWAGKFFGFVDTNPGGKLIELDFGGNAIERDSGSIRWFGAGVATDAPVID
ncbi:MAG: hypothetical protein R2939_04525 [Kofleriaceae bacterium]